MKFLSKSFFFLTCCLGLLSCNNDDNDPITDDNTTTEESSKLEILDITSTSAHINWTVNPVEKLAGTPYSLYLNDSLLSNQISDNFYLLEGLNPSTSYTIVLEYENVNNLISNLQKEFETSASGNLLLDKYIINYNSSSKDTIKLEYNTYDQLVRREVLVPIIFRKGYEYSYNEQQNLKKVQKRGSYTHANIYYNSNEEFNDILIKEGDSDVFYKYEFSDFVNNSYSLSKTLVDMFGGDYSEELVYAKAINFTMDDNQLINVIETNIETQETTAMAFTYSAGNLIEIKLDDETLVISYDDKRNFHTYPNFLLDGDSMYNFSDCGGLLYLDEQFRDKIKFYPHFKHQNENNPIAYKLNGTVVKTFAYEYNELNYPSKINVNPNSSEEIEIVLEYNSSQL